MVAAGPHSDVALTETHRPTAHEGDEHGRADNSRHDARLDLAGRRHEPADHVGGEQQHRREQPRQRQHPAVVAPDRAHGVGHDEADEADRAGQGGGAAHQQHHPQRGERPGAADVLPCAACQVVTQGEAVEGPPHAERRHGAEHHEGQHRTEGVQARAGERPDLPEAELVERLLAHHQHGVHHGRQGRAERCTGERELDGSGASRPRLATAYTATAATAAPAKANQT